MLKITQELFQEIQSTSEAFGQDKGVEMGLGHALLREQYDTLQDNGVRLMLVRYGYVNIYIY